MQNVKYSSFELYLPKHEHQDIPAIVTTALATTDGRAASTTLGLQLTHDLEICGQKCQATQIENIYICKTKLSGIHSLVDQDEPNDLGSQAVIHLQLHTADSLSNIMYAMCNQRRARVQGVIDTFNSK